MYKNKMIVDMTWCTNLLIMGITTLITNDYYMYMVECALTPMTSQNIYSSNFVTRYVASAFVYATIASQLTQSHNLQALHNEL